MDPDAVPSQLAVMELCSRIVLSRLRDGTACTGAVPSQSRDRTVSTDAVPSQSHAGALAAASVSSWGCDVTPSMDSVTSHSILGRIYVSNAYAYVELSLRTILVYNMFTTHFVQTFTFSGGCDTVCQRIVLRHI